MTKILHADLSGIEVWMAFMQYLGLGKMILVALTKDLLTFHFDPAQSGAS